MDNSKLVAAQTALKNVPAGIILFGYESAVTQFPNALAEIASLRTFADDGTLKQTRAGSEVTMELSDKSTFELVKIEGEQTDAQNRVLVVNYGLFKVVFKAGKAGNSDFSEFTTNITAGSLAAFVRDKGKTQCRIEGKEYRVKRGKNAGNVNIGYAVTAVNPAKEGEQPANATKTAGKPEGIE